MKPDMYKEQSCGRKLTLIDDDEAVPAPRTVRPKRQ